MAFPITPLPLAPPAGWPPDVFDGNVIDAAHINEIRDSVFLWPGDVDAGGHALTGLGFLVAGAGGLVATGPIVSRGSFVGVESADGSTVIANIDTQGGYRGPSGLLIDQSGAFVGLGGVNTAAGVTAAWSQIGSGGLVVTGGPIIAKGGSLSVQDAGGTLLGYIDPSGNIFASGTITAGVSIKSPRYDTTYGVGKTGTFTTPDGKTITVDGGVIIGMT